MIDFIVCLAKHVALGKLHRREMRDQELEIRKRKCGQLIQLKFSLPDLSSSGSLPGQKPQCYSQRSL